MWAIIKIDKANLKIEKSLIANINLIKIIKKVNESRTENKLHLMQQVGLPFRLGPQHGLHRTELFVESGLLLRLRGVVASLTYVLNI